MCNWFDKLLKKYSFNSERMRKSILFVLIMLQFSCAENIKPITKESLRSQRENLNESNVKILGNDLQEAYDNLSKTTSYEELLGYVSRKSYKSNLRILKFGSDSFLIYEDIWNERIRPSLTVRIKYLVNADTVRYGQIMSVKKDSLEFKDSLIFKLDAGFFDEIIDKHNEDFDAKIVLNDFMTDFKDLEVIRFACGFTGNAYGEKERKMLCEIKNGQSEYIAQLLKSLVPIDQAIGVVGVIKMQESGQEIDKDILRYRDIILNNERDIYACLGCSNEIVTLNEYLTKFDWEMIPNIELKCADSY